MADNDKETELQQRELELRQREQAIRLREIEAELYTQHQAKEDTIHETTKHQPSETKFKRWQRKLANIAKFVGFVIFVVVAVRIAYWLALGILIGGLTWVGYKLFLENDPS